MAARILSTAGMPTSDCRSWRCLGRPLFYKRFRGPNPVCVKSVRTRVPNVFHFCEDSVRPVYSQCLAKGGATDRERDSVRLLGVSGLYECVYNVVIEMAPADVSVRKEHNNFLVSEE